VSWIAGEYPPRNLRPTVVLKQQMPDVPQPNRSSSGPLWVIAAALVTIAACLVLLVIKNTSASSPSQTAEATDPAVAPVPDKPATTPVKPKPRLRQAIERHQVEDPPTPPPPPDIPVVNEQPVVIPAAQPVVPAPIVAGGLAPLTSLRTDNFSDSGATITGRVILKGSPPPEIINTAISADANCGKFHTQPVKTQFYVVSTNGGLANVFVFIRSGLEGKRFPTPGTPVLLDQVACEYQPYITAAMVKQKIRVKNSDPVLHNVHATPTVFGNRESNRAQMAGSSLIDLSFSAPELPVRIKCDVHPWMFAYVFVVDHPFFAITDENGNFTIKNVPPGKYLVEAFHLKTHKNSNSGVTQSVEIKNTETIEANFVVDLTSGR
jgi:hypothetical protein